MTCYFVCNSYKDNEPTVAVKKHKNSCAYKHAISCYEMTLLASSWTQIWFQCQRGLSRDQLRVELQVNLQVWSIDISRPWILQGRRYSSLYVRWFRGSHLQQKIKIKKLTFHFQLIMVLFAGTNREFFYDFRSTFLNYYFYFSSFSLDLVKPGERFPTLLFGKKFKVCGNNPLWTKLKDLWKSNLCGNCSSFSIF